MARTRIPGCPHRVPLPVVLGLSIARSVSAATWHVPLDLPSVAAAVTFAGPGDTVVVACGTYAEHDVALTRSITIRSETGRADCVTLDAQGLGRVFVADGPSGDVRLEGLTLTGGVVAGGDPWSGWGGGGLFIGGSPELVRCRFTANRATGGGGVAIAGHGSAGLVECIVDGNSAEQGGAVLCWVTSATIRDGTFLANSADSSGGAVAATLSTVTIEGGTFHANEALDGTSLWGDLSTSITGTATVLAFGSGGEAAWCDSTSAVTLTCSDVYGNAGGNWVAALTGQGGVDGNFSADPLFCDALSGDLSLRTSSPCLPGQHPDGAACGLIGAHDAGGCGAPSDVPGTTSPAAFRLQIVPNPFHGSTELRFVGPAATPVTVSILDVRGRRLRTVRASGTAGSVTWDGRDRQGRRLTTGVYFVRLESAGRSVVERALFLR